MKLNELIKIGSGKKRLGRGTGSGHGKTSGRGHKGQKARSGGNVRPGFEGGQMPLVLRLPKKRGFKSLNQTETVTLKAISGLKESKVDKKLLKERGMIKTTKSFVKLVGKSDTKIEKEVLVDSLSESAKTSLVKKTKEEKK